MLVERFVRAVCDRGLPIDSVLAITYTERAAGELRSRIRSRLAELDRHDLARQLDGAWISTIHGFCHRLLKAHPFEAAVDPNFRVLDENQARVLAGEAFDVALEEFCASDDPERIRLLATYGARGLRRMLTRVYETLRSAGRELVLEVTERPGLEARIEELREAARAALDETAGMDKADKARASVARALELLERPPASERLLDLSDVSARGGPRELFAGYEEARARRRAGGARRARRARSWRCSRSCSGASPTRTPPRRRPSRRSTSRTSSSSARDLLRDEPAIRERESWRFRSVLVDEFQDTNRLQCELIDLLATEDLFFVGDEFQSIYRFRHADVEVFRERREASGGVLALTENYRSRPEVLEVINHLFSSDFGDAFRPLSAAGRFEDPAFGPAVELLVTDKASYKDTGIHWRAAEAKHVAERMKDLVDSGEATPGEIVLLFAAGTDARIYEQELRALGLPTFRATGRDYYHQQQVVDLLGYLRLLHNRYDDEALVTVLASPFVGVSNNGLLHLRRAAEKRPLFCGLEKSVPEGSLRAGLAAHPRVPPALRPAGGTGRAELARAALRADHHRARLRPRRPRPVGRAPPLREPAQARAPRPLVRGAARPGRRGLRPLRPRARHGRRVRARGRRRGGGHRCHPAAHDPRREGARVQGRRGRRCGAARRGPRCRRDPLPARRAPRLPRRRPVDGQAAPDLGLPGGEGGRGRGVGGGAAPPLLRRDDARDRPAHRLRFDRPGTERRRVDSDRLGARAARGAGARKRGRGAGRDRPGRRSADAPGRPVRARCGSERAGRRRGVPARPVRRRGRSGRDRGGAAPAGARSGARAAGEPRPQALVQRTGSLRALLVPLLRRAFRRPARDEADARRRRPRARAGRDRDRRFGTRDPRGARPRGSATARGHGGRRARPLPDGLRRRGRAHRRARRGVLQLGDRAAARGPPGRDGRALVRLRARRRPDPRPSGRVPRGRRQGARRRLQDERPRGRLAVRGRRAGVPDPAPRLRARDPARGSEPRSRSSTSSSSARTTL